MNKSFLKTVFYHISAFVIYTIYSFSLGKEGGWVQFCFFGLHSIICIFYALADDSKSPEGHWVSFFLILILGMGTCYKLPFPVG